MKNTVRKATSLTSINELQLSAKSLRMIEGRYDSLDKLVLAGRIAACYEMLKDVDQDYPHRAPYSWEKELAMSLDCSGYIRHDIDPRTFLVGWLFQDIYNQARGDINTLMVGHTKLDSNVVYETFGSLGDEYIDKLRKVFTLDLTGREASVLNLRYGLHDGRRWNLEETADYFYITRERVRQVEAKALRKLKAADNLPVPSEYQEEELDDRIDALLDELRELYRNNLAFKREAEIRREFFELSKAPYRETRMRAQDLSTSLMSMPIETLKLGVRTTGCLISAGIRTIFDVLELPKQQWFENPDLDQRSLEELEEKVQAQGYRFSIF